MYAAEFLTARPAGAAPYYSFVVRDPYVIGSNASCDVCLHCPDILPRLATLTVMRTSQQIREESELAARQQQQQQQNPAAATAAYKTSHEMDGMADLVHTPRNSFTAHAALHRAAGQAEAPAPPYYYDNNNNANVSPAFPTSLEDSAMLLNDEDESGAERDPLVVRLTILPRPLSHGGEQAAALTPVRIGGRLLEEGESHYVQDGDEVQLGEHVALLFRYRPLLTSIAHDVFAPDYIKDLLFMFHRLGATLCTRPVLQPHHPCPIAALHCVEELSDEADCLVALAAGYSVVQPTYVFEWFATLAQCASAPLSVLPAPHNFEVPVRCTAYARTTTYLRPESDTCPFSLYPIPPTAVLNRSRAGLFAGRRFLLLGAAVRYATVLRACGGEVSGEIAEPPRLAGEDVRQLLLLLLTQATTRTAPHDALTDAVVGDHEAAPNTIAPHEECEERRGEAETHTLAAERAAVTTTTATTNHTDPTPSSDGDVDRCYIVVDGATEAAVRAYGVDTAAPALSEALRSVGPALGVIGDHDLFSALLSNAFRGQRLPLYGPVPTLPLGGRGGEDKENAGQPTPRPTNKSSVITTPRPGPQKRTTTTPRRTASPISRYAPEMLLPNVHGARPVPGPAQRARETDRHDAAEEEAAYVSEEAGQTRRHRGGHTGRLTSLLPRTPNRTPSASQLRSCSRLRGRSSAPPPPTSGPEAHEGRREEAEEEPEQRRGEDGARATAALSPRRGRRRFAVPFRSPSCSRAALVESDFDTLRIRLYAFLMKAEPRLDAAIASFKRNHFVDTEAMEQALDAVATARDFAAKVRRLRAAPESAAYVDSLARFAQDCTTLEHKAAYLVRCWDCRLRSLSPLPPQRAAAAAARREGEAHAYYTPRPRSLSTRLAPASPRATEALPDGRAEAGAGQNTPREGRLRRARQVITPGRTRRLLDDSEADAMNGLTVSAEIAGRRPTVSLSSSSSSPSSLAAEEEPRRPSRDEAAARTSGRGRAASPVVHPCRPSRRSQAAGA